MALQILHRTLSTDFLNDVANNAAVRPFVGGAGYVDVGPVVQNPQNVALVNEHGGFIFARDEATRFEVHTLFLPEGRGQSSLAAAEEAARFMFTATDCLEIVTKVPASNKAADFLTRRMGFVPLFTRQAAWPDGSDVTVFSLTLDAWRARDPELPLYGEAFHDALEAAKAANGSKLETHPHDESHDRAVGAACLMARAGNAGKAVWLYNRWARLAGYQCIEQVSVAPVLIDVRDAIVSIEGDKMEVVLCR
jgi:hypothetical protein